jgi:hypothetical protein
MAFEPSRIARRPFVRPTRRYDTMPAAGPDVAGRAILAGQQWRANTPNALRSSLICKFACSYARRRTGSQARRCRPCRQRYRPCTRRSQTCTRPPCPAPCWCVGPCRRSYVGRECLLRVRTNQRRPHVATPGPWSLQMLKCGLSIDELPDDLLAGLWGLGCAAGRTAGMSRDTKHGCLA